MKIIIMISLWLAVWLAAPTARADAQDSLCQSFRAGIKAFEAIERDMPKVLGRYGIKLKDAKSVYRGLCGLGRPMVGPPLDVDPSGAFDSRWGRLSRSDKCEATKSWHSIMMDWFERGSVGGLRLSSTILDDFEDAVDRSFFAMSELGCP